jgi:hypothetical protein
MQMPKKTVSPASFAGKPILAALSAGKKAQPFGTARGGKGPAPAPKPLRLPGKGRGG